jgi:hypothetical protein
VVADGVEEVGVGLPTVRPSRRQGRTARRRSGGRAGKKVVRTAARGRVGAKGKVGAGGAAAVEWGDGELVLAGVRAAMATAFRGLKARK